MTRIQCSLCKIENRELRERVEKAVLAGKALKEIVREENARGIKLHFETLRNHINNHSKIPEVVTSDLRRKHELEQLDILEEMSENLKTAQKLVAGILGADWTDPILIRAISPLLTEIRQILETVYRIRKETAKSPGMDRWQVKEELIDILKEVPLPELNALRLRLEAELHAKEDAS